MSGNVPPNVTADIARFQTLPNPSPADRATIEERAQAANVQTAYNKVQSKQFGAAPEQAHKDSPLPDLITVAALDRWAAGVNAGQQVEAFASHVEQESNAECLLALDVMEGMLEVLKNKPPSKERTACLKKLNEFLDKAYAPIDWAARKGGSPGAPVEDQYHREHWAVADQLDPLSQVQDKINFLKTKAERTNSSNWSSTWSEGNRLHHEMASLSSTATVGQLMEDIFFEDSFKAYKDEFRTVFQDHGIPHIETVEELRALLRGNPMLAEVTLATREQDIKLGRGTIEAALRAKGVPDGEVTGIADKIEEILLSRVRSQYPPDAAKAKGGRGRGQASPEVGKKYNPHVAERPATVALLSAEKTVVADGLLGVDEEMRQASQHGPSPTVVLNVGRLDPFSTGFELGGLGIDDPILAAAIDQALGVHAGARESILEAIKDIPITFIPERLDANGNRVKPYKLSVSDMASHPTMVRMMHRQGLATVCGPSGTTVDIVACLVGKLGAEKVREMLAPLVDMAVPEKPSSPFEAEAISQGDWQKILTSIGYFMQSGHYHSVAEAIAGLWIGATALSNNPRTGESFTNEEILAGYNRLLQIFAAQPAQMLGVNLSGVDSAAVGRLYTLFDSERAQEVSAYFQNNQPNRQI